jgi:signal transduction histidine kinase
MAKEPGKILVVDDDPLNLLRMSRDLLQQGHVVETVEGGPQALATLRAEAFDVVLLDLIMPDMDGRQVLRAIKQDRELRDIPVIIISALDEIDSVVECIEQGAEDYLTKPFKPALLKARLNASLGKKKLRDLEVAYLQQEMALRESEKLATLGKLSAGMAHELNNPAAAARRGVEQLRTAMANLRRRSIQLGATNLSKTQTETFDQLLVLVDERVAAPAAPDALTRSDLEYELESVLDEHGVSDGWVYAPNLVSLDIDREALTGIAAVFDRRQLPTVIALCSDSFAVAQLLDDIGQGTIRITEIVTALKSYAYLDQAPIQRVNVNSDLENTLALLASKFDGAVVVHRDYADDLPPIQAYGSELNQVWTHLIDNAVDAMDGHGEIQLRTRWEEPWVVVEIEDNGPGIPESIQGQLFDPFFTTKSPGKGTGLGLNVSHNIIVRKHGGEISVVSQPGRTVFRVLLPLCLGQDVDDVV